MRSREVESKQSACVNWTLRSIVCSVIRLSSIACSFPAHHHSPALRMLFCEARLGNQPSYKSSLLDRQQHRFWMRGEPCRGDLLRLEKEGVLTKGGPHTVTPLGQDDQRHHEAFRSEILGDAFGCDNKRNRMASDRAHRLDLGRGTQRRGKQDGIKGAPGKERRPANLETMGGGDQCHSLSPTLFGEAPSVWEVKSHGACPREWC
jgi:hypothetical protein